MRAESLGKTCTDHNGIIIKKLLHRNTALVKINNGIKEHDECIVELCKHAGVFKNSQRSV